ETIVMASLMQSLYTTFGMSIYEQMAVILAKEKGWVAERQYRLKGQIDDNTESLIEQLCRSIEPNKTKELELIRNSINPGSALDDHEGVVDVYIRKPDGSELFVDITTVKPNRKEFRSMRRKMLRWAALRMSTNKNAKVDTRIGIPYNPYHPAPYSRWTSNECDPKGDLLVQEELWFAFAGEDVFDDILDAFQEVGREIELEVRNFISQAGD
ncbi:MAG: TdeIII family type II restriction endonuclease, partial [Flavobacteriaceae bacterium]|nr:TdeIII family type II restriction endonuclease [Flavobacteriaceae bacterium]